MLARILVVDDNEVNVELLVVMLASEHYVVSTAFDGFEALAKIAAEKPDIVLLDVMMPELDGFEVCRCIKADPATAHIPVIMVTALSDVDDLVRGFEAGADDFVTKPVNGLALMARIDLQLRRKRDYEDILEQSRADPLTGAFNRGYFDAHAPRLAARCRPARQSLSVLMIDVDNLKQVNDAHGHSAGDRVLKQVVNRVTSALRPSDLVARMGGDEFAVVMPETDLDAGASSRRAPARSHRRNTGRRRRRNGQHRRHRVETRRGGGARSHAPAGRRRGLRGQAGRGQPRGSRRQWKTAAYPA